MAEIGLTEVSATSQEVVSNLVQMTLKQESIALATVADYSQFAVQGASVVKVPRRTQFAAANKAENTALTAQEITFATDDIDLNKHKAIYAKLERIAGVQASVDVAAEVLMEQAKELALQIDKDLIVQLKLASSAAPDHIIQLSGGGTALNQANIIEARRLLNVQKVPMSDRFLMVSPDTEADMLAIADFVRADAYGSAGGLINGEIGRVYGFTVVMHTELSGDEALAYHKSHVGFAMQLNPEFKTDFNLASVSDEYLLHQIYGTVVLDSGKRGIFLNATGS